MWHKKVLIWYGSLNVIGPRNLMGSGILGGIALLEKAWPSWRKCVTVVAGFEVSYARDTQEVCPARCRTFNHVCLCATILIMD